VAAPQSTREQDKQLDELCERHGTLTISMLATRPGWGTMSIEASDGSAFHIDPDGKKQKRR
jgi:hypothetical protein